TPPSHADFHPLSLHDALPIWISSRLLHSRYCARSRLVPAGCSAMLVVSVPMHPAPSAPQTASWLLKSARLRRRSASSSIASSTRSEEHTSELQSRFDIVCRLL